MSNPDLTDLFGEYEKRKARESTASREKSSTADDESHLVSLLRERVLPVMERYASEIRKHGHHARVLDETDNRRPRAELRFFAGEAEDEAGPYSKLKFKVRGTRYSSCTLFLEAKAFVEIPGKTVSGLDLIEEERVTDPKVVGEWSDQTTLKFVEQSLQQF